MGIKAVTALLTVIAGIGGAIVAFWLLNKIAELLPGKWEDRVKPYLFILPAFAAIVLYLVYPAVLTVINSFKDNFSR
ncbi:MAG: sugar ABC transporter permease, partial [Nocardioides sp.]